MSITEQHYSLLEAARLGDTSALDRLLQVCQPDIRRYAYRHCLASDVDDAVQETLLIMTRRLRSLRVVAAFSGWLLQIVGAKAAAWSGACSSSIPAMKKRWNVGWR